MLDLVAALAWVRDNIARFGGDPGQVMIFGQSGGGGKVAALMGMPAAKGLFHRAAIQSGSFPPGAQSEDATALAAAVLDELQVKPGCLDELHTMSVERLLGAGFAVLARQDRGHSGPPDFTKVIRRLGWAPTIDGAILPNQPFDPAAPDISANVPLLVGTNMHEFFSGVDNPDAYSLTEAELLEQVTASRGAAADELLAIYRHRFPTAKPFDLLSLIYAASVRQAAVNQAARKAAQHAAPAYLYWFTWRTPVLDGRPGAFHSSEISFVFDNADRYEQYNGGGPEPRHLAAQMSQAWINMARFGDPNHSELPFWPAYQPEDSRLMRFDAPCRVEEDPDREV